MRQTLWVHVLANAREPLPVAIMSKESGRVPAFEIPLLMNLRILDAQPSVQFLVADAQQLYRLKEIVAKPMIKLFLYGHHLARRLLREGRDKVSPHYAAPIPYYMIKQRHEQVGNGIQHLERQGADAIEYTIYKFCHIKVLKTYLLPISGLSVFMSLNRRSTASPSGMLCSTHSFPL